jgi:YidC/Oxa1 family membrane protein insertase
MQNKNLLIFFLVSFLFVVAWSTLVNRIWPPPLRQPKDEAPATPLRVDPRVWIALQATTQNLANAAPGVSGIGPACQLAGEVALADWGVHEQQLLAKKRAEPPKPKQPIQEAKAAKVEHREAALGDGDENSAFNLKVLLTSKGAAVEGVTLNKFAQANRLGRPAEPPQRLHLVPENSLDPSNILYHYAPPVDGDPAHPVDTLGEQEWKLQSLKNGPNDDVHEAVFTARLPTEGVTLTKTYTLERGTYHLGLTLRMEHDKASPKPVSFRYQLTGGHGLPIEGEWYTTIFRNALVGTDVKHKVWRDLQDSRTIGFRAGGEDRRRGEDSFIRYAAVATQYFASAVVVDDKQEQGIKQSFLAWVRPTLEGVPNPLKPFLDDITVRLVSEPIELAPGVPVVHKYLLYNGPVKVRLLGHLEGEKAVNEQLVDRYETKLGLGTMTDVGNFGIWTNLLIACTNLMHGFLWYLHKYVMPWSYGLCIVLLTVMVRGTMFPVSRKQALASAKMQAKMAEIAPEVKKLEERYKGDKLELQKAKQELYVRRGINPLAMMGSCWMVFAQMPIFLGLYYALQESIHFRLAPFLWIKNLAAPDMLIWWGESIPIISRPEDQGGFLYLGPYFNLLPIIAVTLMIIQQKMLTPPPTDEQQEMQQKMMKYMMVFFGLMFYKVAAGLCMYFIASSLWGVAERKLLPKRQLAGVPAAAPAGGKGSGGRPARLKPRDPKSNGNGTVNKVKGWWQDVLRAAQKK